MNFKLILMSIITGSVAAVSCNDGSSNSETTSQKDSASAVVAIQEDSINYTLDGKNYKGYVVYDANNKDKRPGVLVVHEWWGLNEYARGRAKQLAELGYIAMAV